MGVLIRLLLIALACMAVVPTGAAPAQPSAPAAVVLLRIDGPVPGGGGTALAVADRPVQEVEAGTRARLLAVVADPSLALLLLGLAFWVAEAFVPSFGALGLGGTAAFVLGALMRVDADAPGFGIPPALIVGLALASLLLVGALATVAARSRRRPPAAGPATLLGVSGEVTEADGCAGWAVVQGEHWRVRGAAPLQAGERIRVRAVDGLTLEVEGA